MSSDSHFSCSLSPSLNVCWLFSGPWRGLKDAGEGVKQDGRERERKRELLSLFVFIYLLAQICLSSRLPPVSELLSSVPLNCHACQKGVSTCMYAFCTHIRLSADKNLYNLLLKIGRQHLWPLRCIWCRPCGKTWPYLPYMSRIKSSTLMGDVAQRFHASCGVMLLVSFDA